MLKPSLGTAAQKDTLGDAHFASEQGWELSTHVLMAPMGTPATPALGRELPGASQVLSQASFVKDGG